MEDFVYVVGAVYTHNIYVCTHNVHPQYIQLYVLWVHFVGTHICIVGNTLWVNCCGGSCIYCGGLGIYCGEQIVGSILWVQTYILWSIEAPRMVTQLLVILCKSGVTRKRMGAVANQN